MKLELSKEQDTAGDVWYIVRVEGREKPFHVGNVVDGFTTQKETETREKAEKYYDMVKADPASFTSKTILKSEEIDVPKI